MGLILRYATAPTDIESGTVYDCGKLVFSPSTLLINITDQVYEYKYKRELKPIVKSTFQNKTSKRTYIYNNSNPLTGGLPSMGLHRIGHD